MLYRGSINQIIPPFLAAGLTAERLLGWFREQIGGEAYSSLAAHLDQAGVIGLAAMNYERRRLCDLLTGQVEPEGEEEEELRAAVLAGEPLSLVPAGLPGIEGFYPILRKAEDGWRWQIGETVSEGFADLSACLQAYALAIEVSV